MKYDFKEDQRHKTGGLSERLEEMNFPRISCLKNHFLYGSNKLLYSSTRRPFIRTSLR